MGRHLRLTLLKEERQVKKNLLEPKDHPSRTWIKNIRLLAEHLIYISVHCSVVFHLAVLQELTQVTVVGGGSVGSAAMLLQSGLGSFQPGLQLQQRPLLGQRLHPSLRRQEITNLLPHKRNF